jgi:hypothetical protein
VEEKTWARARATEGFSATLRTMGGAIVGGFLGWVGVVLEEDRSMKSRRHHISQLTTSWSLSMLCYYVRVLVEGRKMAGIIKNGASHHYVIYQSSLSSLHFPFKPQTADQPHEPCCRHRWYHSA